MTWVHSSTIKIHDFFYQVQIPSKCNKINHGSLLHRYLNRKANTLINGNQYIHRSLLIFLTFSNFIDGRFNMWGTRYNIGLHWIRTRKKRRGRWCCTWLFFFGTNKIPLHNHGDLIIAFTSSFPSWWEHAHQKALQKGKPHFHLHTPKL
jgi:hypothetical protein